LIEVEHCSKSFRRSQVLDDVNLVIPAGERAALVGANGAGKTTLIRCLLGEYECDGAVRLGGESPRLRRTQVLRRVGFVPQIPPPLKMPVASLIRFAADLCESDPRQIEAVAARLGLDASALGQHPFVKLSGGQKQKLLIAIALREGVDVMIMDEPAANLDPEARGCFFDLLAGRDHGTTMLISSHRLDEVAALVHRVVELDRGRVVHDDRIADSDALDARLRCRLELRRPEPSAVRVLREWGFRPTEDGTVWEGTVAAPDRLRFFGVLARYSGLVADLQLRVGERPGA
jgi:ABC-2 type transport system ATP-binding protein